MSMQADLYRELPAIDELLRDAGIAGLIPQEGQAAVADACRAVLGYLRAEISAGHLDAGKLALALSGIPAAVEKELGKGVRYSLRLVINATGVILHTNLGRAPLSASALEHIRGTAGTYSNLEFDLDSGERGKRDIHVDRLLHKLLSEDSDLRAGGRAGTRDAPRAPISARGSAADELGGTGVLARPGTAVSTIVVNNNAAAVLLALNTL